MAYDQTAADWQARAEAAEAELRILRAALAPAAVPTTPEHEEAHREMEERFRQAVPDPCADIPDASEPAGYAPAPGELWRTGTSEGTDGLTLYRHTADGPKRGRLVGMMREPADAALVVSAVNAELCLRQGKPPASRADLGESPYPELYQVLRDCEALLAGRNAGNPELLHADLRRMRGELDRAIRAVEDMGDGERG